jgi:hypothetical protein
MIMGISRIFWYLLATVGLAGCSSFSILPASKSATINPWNSYQEMQQAFDTIIPHKTTVEDLGQIHLVPKANPNIRILNYSDILRHFIPTPSINAHELDEGVQECIKAKTACEGYEINQKIMERNRFGNFFLDFFNFDRKVDVVGWRFEGIILIREGVVIYKLSGGEPSIHEFEENKNPLGPLQVF